MNKKNILICNGWTPYPDNSPIKGGTMKSTPELIESLRKYGANIFYRTFLGETTKVISEPATTEKGGLDYKHTTEQDHIAEILSNKYDLVHVTSRLIFNKPELVAQLKNAQTPIIWTLTGPAVLAEINAKDMEYVTAITCLSSGLKQQCVLMGIPEEKLFLISNTIDTDKEKRPEDHNDVRKKIREEHSISEDAIVFTYAGRISPEKKLKTLVDNWEKYIAEHSDKNQYLFILGGVAENNQSIGQKDIPDSPMQALFKYIKSLNTKNVISTGWADIHPYMLASDFAVSTAYMEELSNVALEAASRNVPNIAPVGTHGYIDIIENRISGFLYDLWKDGDLLKALNQAYDLKKNNQTEYIKMSEQARESIINYANSDTVHLKYKDLYERTFIGKG